MIYENFMKYELLLDTTTDMAAFLGCSEVIIAATSGDTR